MNINKASPAGEFPTFPYADVCYQTLRFVPIKARSHPGVLKGGGGGGRGGGGGEKEWADTEV